ncbi:3D domain-containing protein [Mesobacillus harenae]|uniref:3D domain-containing protein n=1 Tax=Mesobacillus harenae TaxID=2213203 RepID=UPI001580FA78|nr:3D domain-containing protein [Mesobacillus harenae]
MKQKLLSLIVTAAFLIAAGTTAQAEQVVVHKGDTLWNLSNQYGVSVESLKKWNNLKSDVIHPNDLLEVSPIKHVKVRSGDNLWNIANVYGVSVDDLLKWNELGSDLIHPGLNLTIYTDLHNEGTVEIKAVKTTTQEAVHKPAPVTAVKQSVEQKQAAKEVMVEATAYTASCEGCIGITKTGVDLIANPGAKVIAVDPSVIPLGSKVHVEGYGYATAEDIGGAIKGNRIDVFIPERNDALKWGRQHVKVTIIN